MFKSILIVNRGEIALRIIRTCVEMGIRTVAVYSDADRESLHVTYADEAMNIGKPLAKKSYLDREKIVSVAKKTGAEAIHPGYGFLAEDEVFTRMCEENDIKFIGPSSESQRKAGNKIEARKAAKRAGVPILPGSEGAVSLEDAIKVTEEIGYPVIIKASGGGGGRGMRVAHNEIQLKEFLLMAKGEASAAFGNPDLYIERYITEPRHIEFQIIADEFGNYVHLGERECSVQKRYQKLIEESPSPVMDEQLREEMGNAAIEVMKAVGYFNAGTVEFLVDKKKNFYVNEINSRLQVEHPVTEMVTGLDLVHLQIVIASGEKLNIAQENIGLNGWSIECRINAEDPEEDFMPSPGVIEKLRLPGGFGVRLDTHIYEGYTVPPFYDSLLGKLVVWGGERNIAIRRMSRALAEFEIEGLPVTIPFHEKVLRDKDFINDDIDTHYLERVYKKM
ncbi:MAG: acetyl-CoA carboxylase biotin carboxylase subunit [Deltaproteobacteria bacterium]|nr:acetyl-CoA carboxylase biotin carboxylase subunit [Deltaproteobacteria bacterium]